MLNRFYRVVVLCTIIVVAYVQSRPQAVDKNQEKRGAFSDMIFPDDILPIDHVPKCPNGDTFCEDIDLYPEEHFKNVLKTSIYQTNFFDDLTDTSDADEFSDRMSFDNYLCASTKTTVFPKVAKNNKNQWKYIYNMENYSQGVTVELCLRKGAPCDLISELPMGYQTFCKQKYIERRMLAANRKGEPITDQFLLPSACVCAYKRNIAFMGKFRNKF